MSRELLIHCDDVHKTYQARRTLRELVMPRHGDGDATRALDGVSFRLERGRVLGIAGESGSGKSTLANLLVGLERPTGGLIRIGDRDLARLRGADLLAFRRQVQMVFQDPFASLNPRFTVRRTVEEPLVIHGTDSVPGVEDEIDEVIVTPRLAQPVRKGELGPIACRLECLHGAIEVAAA